jgi:hypothetical protein
MHRGSAMSEPRFFDTSSPLLSISPYPQPKERSAHEITTQEILTIAGASVAGGALKLPLRIKTRASFSPAGSNAEEGEPGSNASDLPIVMAIAGRALRLARRILAQALSTCC